MSLRSLTAKVLGRISYRAFESRREDAMDEDPELQAYSNKFRGVLASTECEYQPL
jgi:hypothetical protein